MTFKLKSGKLIYANHGIISLTPKDNPVDGCRLTEGYDSPIFLNRLGDDNEYVRYYSKDDILEMCDMMIKRWEDYKKEIENE